MGVDHGECGKPYLSYPCYSDLNESTMTMVVVVVGFLVYRFLYGGRGRRP